jgi:uncharacterized protein (DUF697 family)
MHLKGTIHMPPKSVKALEKIRTSCRTMVNRRAVASGGSALIPVPGIDIAVDVGMLLDLIPAINRKFGLTPEQLDELDPKHKAHVYKMIQTISATLVGVVITERLVVAALKKVGIRMAVKQVAKYIPFAGQAVAAALSFAAMRYVGNSHVDECFAIAKAAIRK